MHFKVERSTEKYRAYAKSIRYLHAFNGLSGVRYVLPKYLLEYTRNTIVYDDPLTPVPETFK